MNLSGIDLNLLVVFDALMVQRHVTRAGQQVGLSQPATSNALARLRKLLDDDLFVRSASGLQPTPKAIALAQQIQPALEQIHSALNVPKPFEPAISDLTFAIGMSDYVEFTLLPQLIKQVQTIAPGIIFQIRSGDRKTQLALLDQGELDLVCGIFPEKVDWHQQQPLFDENFVCLCRHGHPKIQGNLSLETYVAAHHLLVSVKEDRIGRVDRILAKQKLQRHVALSVPHYLVAPGIVSQTDLITTLAERVARTFASTYDLQVLPLPFATRSFSIAMRWHKSNENVAAQRWLRALVTAVSGGTAVSSVDSS